MVKCKTVKFEFTQNNISNNLNINTKIYGNHIECATKIAGKYNGYSEAWSKSTFEAKSLKDLMRLTEEFEGN